MTNRVLTRLSLIVALVVTAHTLKPISGESLSTHLLDAIDSFTFVLPDSTTAHLAQANYIAAAFGRGFSGSEQSTREGVWMQPAAAPASMLAVSQREPGIASRLERRVRKPAARPPRLVAKNKQRIKPVELPAALPLERALAVSLPSIEIAMTRMPMYRFVRPTRIALRPIPVWLPKPGKRTDCDPPVKTRIADEVIIAPAEAPMSGPMEAPMAEALHEAEAIEAAIEMVTPFLIATETSTPEAPRQSCEW